MGLSTEVCSLVDTDQIPPTVGGVLWSHDHDQFCRPPLHPLCSPQKKLHSYHMTKEQHQRGTCCPLDIQAPIPPTLSQMLVQSHHPVRDRRAMHTF